jgi:mannan endo-1,4-beta-mannosidase
MPFVATSGQQFSINNLPVYLTGTNCYYLAYKSRRMVDSALDSAAGMALSVVRTWALMDEAKEGVVFQSWDGPAGAPVYNDGPNGLERLDYVIHAASQRGLKLILPLVNNWTDFGGMDRYAEWYGLSGHGEFYTDPKARRAYRGWATHLLTRTNSITGVEYRDDPAIMAWELTNEARCEAGSAILCSWTTEMAKHLKNVDPNHLLGMGDEGFFERAGSPDWTYNGSTGSDFEALLSVPEIDFGTFHLYPETWGFKRNFGRHWITDHIDAGARAGKPVVMEEYGWTDKSTRNDVYREWLDAMYLGGGAGDMYWMIAAAQDDGTPYPDFDGFTMYAHDVPQAIEAHIARVNYNNSAAAAVTS